MELILQIVAISILALAPALIWLRIWSGKRTSPMTKKYLFIAFILGSLTVFPVFFIHYVWSTFPQTDIVNLIAQTKIPVQEKIIILFLVAAVLEEIAKFLVILYIDKSKDLVFSIHEAIKFGIVAGLGFAFAENIFYFYNVGLSMELPKFLALFTFRSLITVCGHLIFSGVFGNYYGISKFSKSFATQEYWGNVKKLDKRSLTDKELNKKAKRFSKLTIAKGLFIAVAIHAAFNYFLQAGMVNYVLILIGISLIYLVYLYKRRSGYLSLLYQRSKLSHMKDRDKDVVLELLGLWYTQGKYLNVIETSIRLLEKDPTNPLVRLFLNKALDNQRFIDAYTAIRNLFFPKDYLKYYEDKEKNNKK